MQYRYFTKDNLMVSTLGFGCMRFPVVDEDNGKIDYDKAIDMLRYSIDNGVNYIDTAYNYHGGNSEVFLAEALKDGYREKVYIADKNPVWLVEEYEDFERLLDEQLEKLNVDYIDFYLLHSLHKKSWNKIVELKVFDFIEEAKKKGKIKYMGFSFHDEFSLFKEIVDSYDWDFCQIQLNYMDRDFQAGLKGLDYAASKNLSVVIMEPIKGGKLANSPREVLDIFDENPIKRSPAEWALKYLYDFPEIAVILSGMSTMDHVKENIKVASDDSKLTEEELDIINRVTAVYKEKIKVDCTTCRYCLPCPFNVAIPDIFQNYNDVYVYDRLEYSKSNYKHLVENEKDSSMCTECGECEAICPQNLEIIQYLKDADSILSS